MWRDQYEHISLARGHDWAHATARAMAANLHGAARALEKNPLGAPQATTTPHRRRRLQVTRRCVEKHRRHCYPRNPASVSPSSPIGSVTRKARRAAWAWLCPNSLRHFVRCCRSSVDNNLIAKSATGDGLATHRGRGGRDRQCIADGQHQVLRVGHGRQGGQTGGPWTVNLSIAAIHFEVASTRHWPLGYLICSAQLSYVVWT